jgi:hypothetical protein
MEADRPGGIQGLVVVVGSPVEVDCVGSNTAHAGMRYEWFHLDSENREIKLLLGSIISPNLCPFTERFKPFTTACVPLDRGK